MHRCPEAQSREVRQALWHLRNAQTSGDEQSELMVQPSERAADWGASSPEHAATTTTKTTNHPSDALHPNFAIRAWSNEAGLIVNLVSTACFAVSFDPRPP